MSASALENWFVAEVLPLEAILMQYLRNHWRDPSEIDDLRQEVYIRVCEAAQREVPDPAKPFVLGTARNLIIDRIRRQQIVAIEKVADLDALGIAADVPGPDRSVIARDELRRLQQAIDRLPPRCREAVVLCKVEGLTGKQIAQRMGVSEATVSEHIDKGMCALADMLYSEPPEIRRTP
ncbi:MAG TPA: RNA polymerase sigma factor [Rhizomicrobium sp.]|nr:RNA polymerase sigma factor [Rhizomicrobium sp.]